MFDSRETLTTKAFVAGYPIKHSRSPLIHGFWLKQNKVKGSYQKEEVAPASLPDFLTALKSDGRYVGGNVTIPHKELVLSIVDYPDELSKELGAANTLWVEDGRLYATNTDGHGFLSNLDERHPHWDNTNSAVVLGAGGASRAIIQSLRDRGIAEIHVVNRTYAKAQELADRFGPKIHAHRWDALPEVLQDAGLFVNTTSLGMEQNNATAIDFRSMRSGAVVTDIVYVPMVTPILAKANEQGFATVDGLGMLLHQAVPGFEKWFGVRPIVDETLRSLVIADMVEHR